MEESELERSQLKPTVKNDKNVHEKEYVKIINPSSRELVELPSDVDGSLSLTLLQSFFSAAEGLFYEASGNKITVNRLENHLYPTNHFWGNVFYYCLFSNSDDSVSEDSMIPKINVIVVIGLHQKTSEETIVKYFNKLGRVKAVHLKMDLESTHVISDGYAFISFKNPLDYSIVLNFKHSIDGKLCSAIASVSEMNPTAAGTFCVQKGDKPRLLRKVDIVRLMIRKNRKLKLASRRMKKRSSTDTITIQNLILELEELTQRCAIIEIGEFALAMRTVIAKTPAAEVKYKLKFADFDKNDMLNTISYLRAKRNKLAHPVPKKKKAVFLPDLSRVETIFQQANFKKNSAYAKEFGNFVKYLQFMQKAGWNSRYIA